MFAVTPEKERALAARLARLGVVAADLEEAFVRSRGKGGQNVNKVATCVILRHRPSGLQVKCQQGRSQALNRFLARRLLCERLEAQREGRASAERQARERVRRQKRQRSRRARAKLLAAKRMRSEVKVLRRPPAPEDAS